MPTREQIEQVKQHEQTIRRTWLGELDIELADALADLIAHAESLDKTADGEPMVAGMVVYSRHGDCYRIKRLSPVVDSQYFDGENGIVGDEVWSTHEAARAAKGGG